MLTFTLSNCFEIYKKSLEALRLHVKDEIFLLTEIVQCRQYHIDSMRCAIYILNFR